MRQQEPPGGSITLTGSASSFQRFRIVDYTSAKHGVLGFMRGLVAQLRSSNLPIRCNTIAPDWTETGLVPLALAQAAGMPLQSADVVAKSVALLMADEARHGQLIYSRSGEYWEIEENKLLRLVPEIVGEMNADESLDKILDVQHSIGA